MHTTAQLYMRPETSKLTSFYNITNSNIQWNQRTGIHFCSYYYCTTGCSFHIHNHINLFGLFTLAIISCKTHTNTVFMATFQQSCARLTDQSMANQLSKQSKSTALLSRFTQVSQLPLSFFPLCFLMQCIKTFFLYS